MIGSWKVNACLGLTAFIFGYGLSLVNNTWTTSLFRALIGFVLFFVIGYLIRMIFFQMGMRKTENFTGSTHLMQHSMLESESQHLKQNLTKSNTIEVGQKNDTPGATKEAAAFQALSLDALHNSKGGKVSR